MKNRTLIAFLFVAGTLAAQNKQLTVEDAVLRQRSTLAPENLSQANWVTGTDIYYYIDTKTNPDEPRLKTGRPGKQQAQERLTLSELNLALKNAGEPSLNIFPTISWVNEKEISFETETKTVHLTLSDKKVKSSVAHLKFPADAANMDYFGGNVVAYTVNNNLFVYWESPESDKFLGPKNYTVTSDTNKGIVNGQSVHRDEFGISKGTFWSPKGNFLAYYRMDQSMVSDYPIYDLSQQPADVKMIKYPMAGDTSHEVTIGIYNPATGKTIFLQTGTPKDQYLTGVTWSPDEKSIYVAILNRDQNHLWLNRYNASTGAFEKTLFEETSDKYVHPMHPMQFVPNHNDWFVWQSETITPSNPDGLNTLYLYSTDGTLVRKLSAASTGANVRSAQLIVTDTYGFDDKGANFFFQGTNSGNCGRQICTAPLDGKSGYRTISEGEGTHTARFNDKHTYFIDLYSSHTTPRVISIRTAAGKNSDELLRAANPLKDYQNCKIDLFTIKAADGATDLWCRRFLPANFDSTKKYPAMVYVYNGPNVQLVTDTWLGGSDMFLYYMAQQGFVVFTVDGRGSSGRGLKFEQTTFRNLGTQEIADQLKGVDYLKSLRYVDGSKLSVFGWSYGGFMTTSLMTRAPGTFKAAVAGGPVIDWSYYEVMYTERYMDTPQTNPDGYKTSSLFNYVDKLQGKLLMIHGTSDDVVVWQHSLLYLKKCVEKGKQLDYFVYPGHLHNVLGKDRVHLMTKVSEYIKTNGQ